MLTVPETSSALAEKHQRARSTASPARSHKTAKFWYFVTMAKSSHANPTGTIPAHQRVGSTAPPAWIKPQLAKLVNEAPDAPDWLHELKLDGYRMHARLDADRAQILTRRGNDWTDKYPAIAKSIAGLPTHNAYLDGELWAEGPRDKPGHKRLSESSVWV
jgi:ATP-dependent DNA ligase